MFSSSLSVLVSLSLATLRKSQASIQAGCRPTPCDQPTPECCPTNTLIVDNRHCLTNHCWTCAKDRLGDLHSVCMVHGISKQEGDTELSDCKPGTTCVVKCKGDDCPFGKCVADAEVGSVVNSSSHKSVKFPGVKDAHVKWVPTCDQVQQRQQKPESKPTGLSSRAAIHSPLMGVEMLQPEVLLPTEDLNERWAPTESGSKEETKKDKSDSSSASSSEEKNEVKDTKKCSCDEKGCRHYNAGSYCILKNVNKAKPKDGCYDDTDIDTGTGRYYSFSACDCKQRKKKKVSKAELLKLFEPGYNPLQDHKVTDYLNKLKEKPYGLQIMSHSFSS